MEYEGFFCLLLLVGWLLLLFVGWTITQGILTAFYYAASLWYWVKERFLDGKNGSPVLRSGNGRKM